MKVVVLEHFTSSPTFRGDAAIRTEGRAMRDAIVADLVALPGVGVTVLRSGARPPAASGRLEILRVPRAGGAAVRGRSSCVGAIGLERRSRGSGAPRGARTF